MSNNVGLTAVQESHAHDVISVGHTLGLSDNFIICGLMTACVESGLQNYANANVAGSLALPHDAVGSDHLSVGIMQQQVPMWGPVTVCQTAIGAANLFFQQLMSRYSPQLTLGENCQRVQGSAFPDRYAAQEARARQIFAGVNGTASAEVGTPVHIIETWLGEEMRTFLIIDGKGNMQYAVYTPTHDALVPVSKDFVASINKAFDTTTKTINTNDRYAIQQVLKGRSK